MRSPDTAMEAGEWTRNSPNSSPRSGPGTAGVTAASRSWIKSDVSAICVISRGLRQVEDHLQLVRVLKHPAAPREELRCKLFGDYLRDGPCQVGVRSKKGLQEPRTPTIATVGAGYDEGGQGEHVRFWAPDQGVGAMVEVKGTGRSDRVRERLRGQYPG